MQEVSLLYAIVAQTYLLILKKVVDTQGNDAYSPFLPDTKKKRRQALTKTFIMFRRQC